MHVFLGSDWWVRYLTFPDIGCEVGEYDWGCFSEYGGWDAV